MKPSLLSTFDDFLSEVYPSAEAGAAEARAVEVEQRLARLADCPHAVVLQLAYPQMDFANRWCWRQFGPARGECQPYSSEYRTCFEDGHHVHEGRWITHWLAKTNYDFGFNEWCFASRADQELFLAFMPQIGWGENYSAQPLL